MMIVTKTSHPLLDALKKHLGIKFDIELSAMLGLNSQMACMIRNGYKGVTNSQILAIHELTGWSIAHIKSLIPETQQPTQYNKRRNHACE